MKPIDTLNEWLVRPPVTGILLLPFFAAVVGLPTLIRGLVDGTVSGVAFLPYMPFVVASALLMGWRSATLVALVSAGLADLLFIDPRFVPMAGPTDMFGVLVFLSSSALVITLTEMARFIARSFPGPVTAEPLDAGIIFSLESGQAWASWYGAKSPIRLGPEEEVAGMMQDFLAQLELARRLGGTSN